MPSYFSSLLTTTTSRVATLRANLLPNENDGDTPDDTHLCRVLRAYYVEKGRQFPAWLPPDPKLPPPVVVQPVYTSNVGSSYGGMNRNSGGTALSSLWDSQPQSTVSSPPIQPSRGPTPGARPASARPNPFARQQQPQRSDSPQSLPLARPLPSQREGSYQSVGRPGDQPLASPGSGNGQYTSAKDRLRKLARPKMDSPRTLDTSQQTLRNNSSQSASASSASSNNYEDRFAPPESGYPGVRSRAEKPFVAATSPWASTENEFGGGGYGYNSGGQSAPPARPGLPSGPAANRRGPMSSGERRW